MWVLPNCVASPGGQVCEFFACTASCALSQFPVPRPQEENKEEAAGFVILEDQVNRESHDWTKGEELLDHACRVATAAQPKN